MSGDGVFRYLVRYGAPGFVGRFGSIRKIDVRRGTRVVVATDRGLEAGEVLVGPDDAESGADRGPPAGELLRVMTGEDLAQEAQLRDAHLPVLERCRRLIEERGLDAAVVEGETLLDGRRILLYFLGPPSEKLGPLAVELGRESGSLHVQFQPLETPVGETSEVLDASPAPEVAPLSRQETIKHEAATRWPKIAAALDDPSQPRLAKDDAFLLELHGVYQQENRDLRRQASPGEVRRREHAFMVRTRPPGGRLTAVQLLAHLDIADRFGKGTLRITSRQGLQLHGVAKGDVRSVLQAINAALATTLGACGDVSRNVMCCPAPLRDDPVRARLQATAAEIARHFTPRSSAYYEIWLDELPPHDAGAAEEEPVYGPAYLPRKFKIALGAPDDNCVDVFTQDIGLVAVAEGGRLAGFDVLVGGGLAVSPKRQDTFPRLAEPLAFVPAGEELRIIDAIVQVHRDHSSRNDRRRARLKYLVADQGIAAFKAMVEGVLEAELAPPHGAAATGYDDHLGWRPQGDGRLFLGAPIANGRIQDDGEVRLKTALRELLTRHASPVRLTPQQNILLCDIPPERKAEIEDLLQTHGVPLVEELSPLRRHALACPALPTCGLAVAEAERLMPKLLDEVEHELTRRGLEHEPFTLRVAGCPNACSRTATADIALVGQAPGKYALYAGGCLAGDRLNVLVREGVAEDRLMTEIAALLATFQERRSGEESLGNCWRRIMQSETKTTRG
jgi:sulfite reductase (ferredoxin)